MTDNRPMPQQGGSYIRQPDGSLVLDSRTEDAAAPIGLAEAEPEAGAEADPPAKPRRQRTPRPAVALAPAEPPAETPPPAGVAATPEETA